jgi:hypothetical protein
MDAPIPLQAIVQGLLTVSGTTPTFSGRGVSAVARSGLGTYVLTFDAGLIGNAGEVDPTKIRSLITLRGSSTATITGGVETTGVGITYITPGTDGGMTQFQLVFTQGATGGTAVDPTAGVASGVEIVIYKSPT